MLGYLKGNWRFLVKINWFCCLGPSTMRKSTNYTSKFGEALRILLCLTIISWPFAIILRYFWLPYRKLSHIFISNAQNSYTAHYSTFNQSTNRSRISAKLKKATNSTICGTSLQLWSPTSFRAKNKQTRLPMSWGTSSIKYSGSIR